MATENYDLFDTGGSGGLGFMAGLLTGALVGAGIAMLLAPKTGVELRGQLNEQAQKLGEQAQKLGTLAAEQYKKAGEVATEWAGRSREFVDRARADGREAVS